MPIHTNSNLSKNYTFESSHFLFTFFIQLGGWFFLHGKLIGNPVKSGNCTRNCKPLHRICLMR